MLAFSDDDKQLITSVARQISLAIERSQHTAELRFRTTVATRTAWAAEIAHDINHEISRIRKHAYMLMQNNPQCEQIQRYAHDIDESASRLAGVAAAPRAIPKSPILLDAWLEHRMREIVQERGADIELDLRDLGCPEIYIDGSPIVLERVLRHLVRNAAEAMNSRGAIVVRTRRRSDEYVEVQIIDSGPGIPEEYRQRLFNDVVTTKGPEGGLGLLFARSAIEEMNGAIVLQPAVAGQGAAFTLTLPISLE